MRAKDDESLSYDQLAAAPTGSIVVDIRGRTIRKLANGDWAWPGGRYSLLELIHHRGRLWWYQRPRTKVDRAWSL